MVRVLVVVVIVISLVCTLADSPDWDHSTGCEEACFPFLLHLDPPNPWCAVALFCELFLIRLLGGLLSISNSNSRPSRNFPLAHGTIARHRTRNPELAMEYGRGLGVFILPVHRTRSMSWYPGAPAISASSDRASSYHWSSSVDFGVPFAKRVCLRGHDQEGVWAAHPTPAAFALISGMSPHFCTSVCLSTLHDIVQTTVACESLIETVIVECILAVGV